MTLAALVVYFMQELGLQFLRLLCSDIAPVCDDFIKEVN